jgi:hypothetical protein
MPTLIEREIGDISAVSSELEMHTPNHAQEVIANFPDNPILGLEREVNSRDIVEGTVSMTPNVDALNQQTLELLRVTRQTLLGVNPDGLLHTGSQVLRNTEDVQPAMYRTTALSHSLSRELLGITSHQIVIGIAREGRGAEAGEDFAVMAYNMLRRSLPVLLGISASSPYRVSPDGTELVPTELQTQRMAAYERGARRLPRTMLEPDERSIYSLTHYQRVIQRASDQVNQALWGQQLDANYSELFRERENGPYAPFSTLAPHQVYWPIRWRSDHATADSLGTIEIRVPDIGITVDRMQALNSYVMGLVYYIADHGDEEIFDIVGPVRNDFEFLLQVGRNGLSQVAYSRAGVDYTLRAIAHRLFRYSEEGLNHRGQETTQMSEELYSALGVNTDAERIRRYVRENHITNPRDLEIWLANTLAQSIGM